MIITRTYDASDAFFWLKVGDHNSKVAFVLTPSNILICNSVVQRSNWSDCKMNRVFHWNWGQKGIFHSLELLNRSVLPRRGKYPGTSFSCKQTKRGKVLTNCFMPLNLSAAYARNKIKPFLLHLCKLGFDRVSSRIRCSIFAACKFDPALSLVWLLKAESYLECSVSTFIDWLHFTLSLGKS